MIFLIRHGETAGNANRVVQVPETPLSERGVSQAARLGARLAGTGISNILASDLTRAAMTAEALAAATGAPVAHSPLLHERSFGELRGTPYSVLEGRGIQLFAVGYTPPGGESWAVFHERVDAAWLAVESAAAAAAGHLAVVTHGLVCHSVASRKLALSPDANAAVAFPNTSVTLIEGPPWRAVLVGCDAHLVDTERPGGGAV